MFMDNHKNNLGGALLWHIRLKIHVSAAELALENAQLVQSAKAILNML